MSSSVTSRNGGGYGGPHRAFPTSPARSASTSRSYQFSVANNSNNSSRVRSSSNPRPLHTTAGGPFPQNAHSQSNRDDLSNLVDDEDLRRFKITIDESPVDEWRTRTTAFELLISSIPEIKLNYQTVVPKWYQSSQSLARLSNPLSSLILDARSTVVKHACHHILLLIQRCNLHNPPSSDVCRYLLRDLIPSILNLSAQTVTVIRNYAVEMMCKVIPVCRFKSGLPLMLDRLRCDKSRDVREACVRYLKLVLQHWCGTHTFPSDSAETNLPPQPYLSRENCMQIGKALAYSLSDPSQTVRLEARQSFEIFHGWYPELWSEILHDPDGIFAKDMKLKKTILDSANRLSSERSANYSSIYDRDDCTVGTFESRNADNGRSSSNLRQEIPTVRVGPVPSRPTPGIRGPPSRTADNPFSKLPPKVESLKGSTPKASQYAALLNLPSEEALVEPNIRREDSGQRKQFMIQHVRDKAARIIQTAFRVYIARTFINSSSTELTSLASVLDKPSRSKASRFGAVSVIKKNQKKVFSVSGDESVGSISSALQTCSLDDHGISIVSSDRDMDNRAKSRNSSMLLIKRLQKCGTPTSSTKHDSAMTDQHAIASQLLAAHKSYIDEFMECLQAEMKLIKNFEEIMKSSRSSDGTRPSEEDVISYFESVYQLLDKETHNSNTLRSALVRISQGEQI